MGLYGIISVLDGSHYQIVKDLWTEIDRSCGPRSPVPHPIPHFTYQTAEDYDLTQLNEIFRALAARSRPFWVPTAGLGVFGDDVVYIVVPRVPHLDAYHARFWPETLPAARTPPAKGYSPDEWVPHITLALGPQIRDKVPEIVRLLYQRDLEWRIEVNNLTVVYEDDTHKEFISRHDFPGAAGPPPKLT
jgi:2'-5' RNA ligase